MRAHKGLVTAITVAVPLWAGFAAGQDRPAPDKPVCDQQGKMVAPQKVEGQVVRVDTAQGKVAVREADGKTHEFQASREALQGLKVGDRIEAKLRAAPSC